MNIPTEIDPETFPDHDPDRFKNFYEIMLDGRPAFQLQDGSTFFLDSNNGWCDEKNCYYNSLGEALGWYKTFENRTFFYNIEGFFVPYSKDPSTLPKHNPKVNITELDADFNFLDQDGCYYDRFGEPLGWKLKCEDNQFYFFDLNGDYVDIIPTDQKNDLLKFDLGDFKQDFQQEVQLIKSTQKPYPKEEPKVIIKTQTQQQQQQIQHPQQQKKSQIIKKPVQQQKDNLKIIYHYEFPDPTDETKKMCIALIKSKLQTKPEFTLNGQLLTVKCDQQIKELEQDLQLENGKCVKFKK
ncbi:unnamed protein product [Paramecium pentaurelia]|uniref:Uncharacterized protein n=1 Tax=Paramecium pentaurelia TaxID=43138 RepID=A0A8S1WFG2_9CILI|nr:unnamed protein product [Paramecium pentaurelia]